MSRHRKDAKLAAEQGKPPPPILNFLKYYL